MKKIICLFLVFITLSLCLVGCSFDDAFKWLGITTKPKTQIVPNFEHGDNLTNEDFYFITEHLRNKGLENPMYPSDFSDSVNDFKKRWGTFDNTIFKVKINTSSPVYYICAYMDKDVFESFPLTPPFSIDYGSDIQHFVWHKFEHKNDIPEKIDNCFFMGAYAVYSGSFEEDLLNDKKVDYACKYFVPVLDGYSELESDLHLKYQIPEYVFLKYSADLERENYIFIPHGTYKQLYDKKRSLIIDNDGDYCLYVLTSSEPYDPDTFSFEDHRSKIGYLYDEMLPYLRIVNNSDSNSGYKIYINLEYFLQR